MRIDIPEVLEALNGRYCQNCCGEGSLLLIGRNPVFDPSMGNWYPSEETEPCDDCQGTGDYHYPAGHLGIIIERIDQLTPTEREGLLHLYEHKEATLTGSTFQALWQLLEDIEIEAKPDDPATTELHALLAACTVLPEPPAPASEVSKSIQL